MGNFFKAIIQDSRGTMPSTSPIADPAIANPVSGNALFPAEHVASLGIDRLTETSRSYSSDRVVKDTGETRRGRQRGDEGMHSVTDASTTKDLSGDVENVRHMLSESMTVPFVDSVTADNSHGQPDQKHKNVQGSRDKGPDGAMEKLSNLRQDSSPVLTDTDEHKQIASHDKASQPDSTLQSDVGRQLEESAPVQDASAPAKHIEHAVPDHNVQRTTQVGTERTRTEIAANVKNGDDNSPGQYGDTQGDLKETTQPKNPEKPSPFVVKHETHVENNIFRPVKDNRAANHPQVRIGLVNVIVEGPKQTQSVSSGQRRDDSTSRHYLRSL